MDNDRKDDAIYGSTVRVGDGKTWAAPTNDHTDSPSALGELAMVYHLENAKIVPKCSVAPKGQCSSAEPGHMRFANRH